MEESIEIYIILKLIFCRLKSIAFQSMNTAYAVILLMLPDAGLSWLGASINVPMAKLKTVIILKLARLLPYSRRIRKEGL